MRHYLYMLSFFILVSCNCQNYNNSKLSKKQTIDSDVLNDTTENIINPDNFFRGKINDSETSFINNIIKKVSDIQEIQKFSKLHKDTITYYIMEKPSKNYNYFRIQVGLETETHFSAKINFYIKEDTSEIQVLEVVEDSLMSIDDWRKSKYYSLYFL